MGELKLSWKPQTLGASQPRVKAYNAKGHITLIQDNPQPNGEVFFLLEETDLNRDLIKGYLASKAWSCEQVDRPTDIPKAVPKIPEPPKERPTGHPQRALNRAEVMDFLDKNGIHYRTNEKSETLFRKLPDDVKRSCKLG
jgi:hypothetical protein